MLRGVDQLELFQARCLPLQSLNLVCRQLRIGGRGRLGQVGLVAFDQQQGHIVVGDVGAGGGIVAGGIAVDRGGIDAA